MSSDSEIEELTPLEFEEYITEEIAEVTRELAKAERDLERVRREVKIQEQRVSFAVDRLQQISHWRARYYECQRIHKKQK